MSKIGHYYCKNSRTGIKDGDYSIDYADERMKSYAIWTGGQYWAFAEFKSQRAAFNFLLEEFEEVEKIEE